MQLNKTLVLLMVVYSASTLAEEVSLENKSADSTVDKSLEATTIDKKAEEDELKSPVIPGMQSAADFFATPIIYNPASLDLPNLSGAKGINPLGGRTPAPLTKFDNLSLIPTFGVRYGHNDNITQLKSSRDSSSFFTYTPQLIALLDQGRHKYTLTYNSEITNYTDSSRNNLDNHNLSLAGSNVFNARHKLNWALAYINGAEPINLRDGRRLTANFPNNLATINPDEFNAHSAKALYTYGANGARGNVELSTQYNSKDYTNNRDINSFADFDSFKYGAEFLYRVFPKTQVVLDVNKTNTDYKSALNQQDNLDTRYLLGVRWKALAKTEGFFKIGRQEKDYDLSSLRTATGSTYEGGFRWQPKTYSNVDFKLTKSLTDASAAGILVGESKAYLLSWTHAWKNYFRTTATASYNDTDSPSTNPAFAREDKTRVYGVSALYDVTRWMGLGFDFTKTTRDSTNQLFEYDNDVGFISVNLNL